MSEELKPCPFCGGEHLTVEGAPDDKRICPETIDIPWLWAVFCADCGASGPDATSNSAACDKWNRRSLSVAGAEPVAERTAELWRLALIDLYLIYPNFRQLIDGFMTDPAWNQQWDKDTRDELIAWRLKHDEALNTAIRTMEGKSK